MDDSATRLSSDLDQLIALSPDLWDDLRGANVFMTGGTGFFGCWMLESLLQANRSLGLGAHAVVLTRDPKRFGRRVPHLANDKAISFVVGDLRGFEFPEVRATHILHMGMETNTSLAAPAPSEYFDTAVDGTRRVLEYARACGAGRLLLTSSGAVYGPQPADCDRVGEDARLAPAPEDVCFAYGQAKRAAEFLCAAAHAETGIGATVARCFAFVGPYLPLDSGFAIGNFIADALNHEVVQVGGDGTPLRSYLYASDLARWLWTILLKGTPARPYNVGAEEAVTIAELAHVVAETLGAPGVRIAREPISGVAPHRYVPDTRRAANELGLQPTIGLPEAISRTAAWNSPVR